MVVAGGGAAPPRPDPATTMTLPPELRDALRAMIAGHLPGRILTVGLDDPDLLAPYLARQPQAEVTAASGADLLGDTARLPRFDLALVADTLEHMSARDAGVVIARLRDLHARRLLVVVRMGPDWPGQRSHWESGDLLAYGLRRAAGAPGEHGPVHVYRFDLRDYKQTPEWLSPKDWANPEQWGKYPKLFDDEGQ